MTKFRFEETDPFTGMVTRYWMEDDGKIGIQRVNPAINEIVDRNKAIQNEELNRKWGDGKVFASVPLEVVESELWEAIKNKDQTYLKKWLNDADNRDFRRKLGSI